LSGQPSLFGDEVSFSVSGNENVKCVSGALQIANSQEEDHGKYECVAENSVGTAFSKPTLLYVKGIRNRHIE